MRRNCLLTLISVLCLFFLTACGGTDNQRLANGEYYVILSEIEELFPAAETDGNATLLGTQYWQEEAVQIWAEQKSGNVVDVYLRRTDNSRETLFEGLSREHRYYKWYIGEGGSYYLFSDVLLVEMNASGEKVQQLVLEASIVDMCLLENGQIFLLLRETTGELKLAELRENGEVTKKETLKLGNSTMAQIASEGKNVLFLDDKGVWKIDVKNAERTAVMEFTDKSYEPDASASNDLRIVEDGAVEILLNDAVERLRLVDVAESREAVVMRGWRFDPFWEELTKRFNQQSDTYYVVMEEGYEREEKQAFVQRTEIDLASGVGADIIFENALSDVYGLIQKGCFEDIRPFLEQSGLQEEDYFPAAFGAYREDDKIYSVCPSATIDMMWIREDLLGGREQTDIYTLVDALADYKEEAMFFTYMDSLRVLEYFLCGSENLWGMLDWEKGSCDFDTELFVNMLEVSKRYGNNGKGEVPNLAGWFYNNFYQYLTLDGLDTEGKVPVNYLFDDGNYPAINYSFLFMINSKSEHKQGAWEFAKFILSEEAQSNATLNPVNIAAFDKEVKKEIEEGSIVQVISDKGYVSTHYKAGIDEFRAIDNDEEEYKEKYDLTAAKAEEIKANYLVARGLPVKTIPILDIIYEEVAAYFNDSKSIEEVVAVIENRVGLYLSEQN